MGDGGEDAGAVAGVLLAAARAAVGHADEHFERLRDVLAGRRLGEFPDEADAARVAIISRVEEALRLSRGVGGTGAAAGSAVAFGARRGRSRAR